MKKMELIDQKTTINNKIEKLAEGLSANEMLKNSQIVALIAQRDDLNNKIEEIIERDRQEFVQENHEWSEVFE